MTQLHLINSVIEWERSLKFMEERQKNRRSDPYVNYLAAPQSRQIDRNKPKEVRALFDFVKALNPNL